MESKNEKEATSQVKSQHNSEGFKPDPSCCSNDVSSENQRLLQVLTKYQHDDNGSTESSAQVSDLSQELSSLVALTNNKISLNNVQEKARLDLVRYQEKLLKENSFGIDFTQSQAQKNQEANGNNEDALEDKDLRSGNATEGSGESLQRDYCQDVLVETDEDDEVYQSDSSLAQDKNAIQYYWVDDVLCFVYGFLTIICMLYLFDHFQC
ncbi:unnamed protein product [Moneuplotes crassus]|uniref:Uncharacterized protein n=1 Tax=Euplotes crassus TaxID=5936 RepID=A0AAD2D235_EUPCR|nr:unnamed protein product [Moneuplotes crassus]